MCPSHVKRSALICQATLSTHKHTRSPRPPVQVIWSEMLVVDPAGLQAACMEAGFAGAGPAGPILRLPPPPAPGQQQQQQQQQRPLTPQPHMGLGTATPESQEGGGVAAGEQQHQRQRPGLASVAGAAEAGYQLTSATTAHEAQAGSVVASAAVEAAGGYGGGAGTSSQPHHGAQRSAPAAPPPPAAPPLSREELRVRLLGDMQLLFNLPRGLRERVSEAGGAGCGMACTCSRGAWASCACAWRVRPMSCPGGSGWH